MQWDTRCCATHNMLAKVLDDRRGRRLPLEFGDEGWAPGAIRLTNGTGFLPGGPGDPCHGCVELATRLGLPLDVFAPGFLLEL